ncbi:MAG: hypothetical protein K2X32_12285, partial [Phycisphaerales bacterium]|nr:hypothetical protein [Phycisphaerales bacterium]
LASILPGCGPRARDLELINESNRAQFADARIAASNDAQKSSDRDRLMHDMNTLIAALADGVPAAGEAPARRVYDTLRTAGINEGKTVEAFFTTEDSARTYKGEPFEQALSFCYIGLFDALSAGGSDWGNLRAGANNSLFTLRDFVGSVTPGQPRASANDERRDRSTRRTRRAMNEPAPAAPEQPAPSPDPSAANEATAPATAATIGTPIPSDFALGYALRAVAARQLNEPDEVRTTCEQLAQIDPDLRPLADLIQSGQYNTVLVVDFGIAPAKVATGDDRTIIRFQDQTPSTRDALIVRAGESRGEFPVLLDVNALARQSRWTNLEPMRRAKSLIGSGLIGAGAGALIVGTDQRSQATQLAGVGAIAAGLLLKATSYADTRQIDLMPQRVYLVLLDLPAPGAPVELQIARFPESRVVLPFVPTPRTDVGNVARLHFVRLPSAAGAWATQPAQYWGDGMPPPNAPGLSPVEVNTPYILGGRCVRTPSDAVLDSYHRAGVLTEIMSISALEQLYRDEGIKVIASGPRDTFIGAHILERGTWLFSPLPASTGAARVYNQLHPPYVPRSPLLQQLRAKYAPVINAESASPRDAKSPSDRKASR